jgi:formate--tetrahydrofolate ligase
MKPDLEIAQGAKLLPIHDIAGQLGIDQDFILPYGLYKAKVSLRFFEKLKARPDGKLIMVTAITPTAFGEGKTTTAIGLSMALNRIGKKSIVTLREPSLGPVFGIKGGAAGGGYAQVLPMEDINLHFTGDIHAVSAAHNLLAAILDNHFHFGNKLLVDEREILYRRTMDMNDRSLRNIVVGLGGRTNGPAREDGFIITAASEVMAILALAVSVAELRARLCRMLVAFDMGGKPLFAGNFNACGSMTVLLKDAIKPNLVQTIEHTPAFIHAGPFANIAHGTNSVVATNLALKLSDYVVTEVGFGSDLGAEKFVDIVARTMGYRVAAAVVVATVRALKLHGGAPEKDTKSGTLENLKNGLPNLAKHIENVRKFRIPAVVALNYFDGDTDAEIESIRDFCAAQKVACAVVRAFEQGSAGALELAETIVRTTETEISETRPIYGLEDPIETKIEKVATEIYGANRVVYTPKAEKDIARIEKIGFGKLPVCIAKTNRSLSDNPTLYGRPVNFKIAITDVNVSSGAGFLVPLAGEVMLMPGLAKVPNAERISIDDAGKITGLS